MFRFFLFLIFCASQPAHAFVCLNRAAVCSKVTVASLNSLVPCSATQMTGFDAAQMISYNSMVAQVAALNAASAVSAGNVFDPVLGAAFWSFAMTFVFGCFLIAKNAGIILSVFRKF